MLHAKNGSIGRGKAYDKCSLILAALGVQQDLLLNFFVRKLSMVIPSLWLHENYAMDQSIFYGFAFR